ncbi:MAG: alpha/beta hydrolase [Planctomycetota bacterium]
MFAEVNGTRIYYEVAGEGHPLVLIHGSTLDSRMWDDQFDVFARSYRVIRYDARGHGKSALPTNEPYIPAEDLNALLERLEIRQANILGLSMGGAIAIDFTLLFPKVVSGLILVDSRPDGWKASPELSALMQPIILKAQENNLPEAKQLWLEHPLFESARKRPRAAAQLKQIISDFSGWQWDHTNPVKKLSPQAIHRLEEITAPTLIIVGERDLPDFHAIATVMHQSIRDARKVMLPDVGHIPNMETPDTFNQTVLGFLQEISGSITTLK